MCNNNCGCGMQSNCGCGMQSGCGCGCGMQSGFGGMNSWIWIILIIVLLFGCGGGC